MPVDNMSVHSNVSANTVGPSFQIDLASLIKTKDLVYCNDDDARQVEKVVRRHMSALKKVNCYSSLLKCQYAEYAAAIVK